MPKSPTTPLRAHHRLMQTLVSTFHKGAGTEPRPGELDKAARVFVKAGGSWERAFLGSVDDMCLLKKVIKIAVKNGHFTKKPVWGE